jgi:hypothetical protein
VDRFLFDDRAGYCEQFATAEVLMLRGLGIPARLATGYAPGEYAPLLHQAIVRERDAHAWVEVWLDGHGWVPMDPSPGFPSLAAAGPAGGWLVPGLAAALPRLPLGAVGGALAPGGLATPAAVVTIALAGTLAAALIGRRWRRWARARRRRAGTPELLAVYERLQRRLARRRAPPETPNEYRRAVAGGELDELVGEVTEAVNRAAYAGRWPSPDALADLRRRAG